MVDNTFWTLESNVNERDASSWHAAATLIRPRTDAFIEGSFAPAASHERFASVNPATGEILGRVAACDQIDVDRAVRAARRAFEDRRWGDQHPRDRKAVLLRLAELIRAHADELALLDSLDAGKLISDTTTVDVPGSAAILQWYAEAIDKTYGEIAPTGPGDLALVAREPLGVVGAVVPWNYPLETAIWKIAPALAAGNSVVLKPAEESPLSALRLAELAAEAGLPDGVLNVVPGTGPVAGQALGRHPDVDVLTFTGSTVVGKLFQRYAGESNMKQVWLECGGKSANLVFADVADLDRAADGVIAGIFTHQGQVCSANSRLLVDNRIKAALLDRVLRRAKDLRPGDPLDPATGMGPLIGEGHAERVLDYIRIGRAEATALLDGDVVDGAPTRAFLTPAIFDDVDPAGRLAVEEIFGPVLSVFGFDDEEQAVRLANGSIYALAASVWSDSLSRAHRVARRLRAGTVSVNTVDALDVTTPFGGFGQSGHGRDLSLHALTNYTALKTTWVDYR